MKTLRINLVTWNGEKYIPYLIDSLKKQSYQDFKLNILDNASTDKTVELLKVQLEKTSFDYELHQNQQNTGFGGGHNALFDKTQEELVLLLNQDMYLDSECIEKLVSFLKQHTDITVIAPRLMKWNFGDLPDPTMLTQVELQKSFTDQVDSLGLKVLRNRRVIEQHNHESWENIKTQFERNSTEVFGVSGALPMFRTELLKELLQGEKLFDPFLESYKEDVDLAFRLRQRVGKSYVILDALAYHDRTGSGAKSLSDWSASKNKTKQPSWVKYYSYRNHVVVLYKNEYWHDFILDFPWILWYELKKFVFFLLFDRQVLKGLGDIWRQRKKIKELRVHNKALRKIKSGVLSSWRKREKATVYGVRFNNSGS